MQFPNLDMDVLRTLVLAEQLGGFVHAAGRIGRSQSAVSQQVRKIEDQLGQRLFVKQGRGLMPTAAGETLLAYARRILDLNDEALSAINGHAIGGSVRLGLPADFADSWLPDALGRFHRAHRAVRLETVVDRNRALVERLDRGELDLVLAIDQAQRPDTDMLAQMNAVWIGPQAGRLLWDPAEPVPLIVSDAPCFFRQRALATLDEAGIQWRVALTCPSVYGLWAAIKAGLGVTLRTALGLPDGVRVMARKDKMPMPRGGPLALSLHDGGRRMEPAAQQLYAILREEVLRKTAV